MCLNSNIQKCAFLERTRIGTFKKSGLSNVSEKFGISEKPLFKFIRIRIFKNCEHSKPFKYSKTIKSAQWFDHPMDAIRMLEFLSSTSDTIGKLGSVFFCKAQTWIFCIRNDKSQIRNGRGRNRMLGLKSLMCRRKVVELKMLLKILTGNLRISPSHFSVVR